MAKKDRSGYRKKRSQTKPFRNPELGYYLIVTDTEGTERCYFEGLHANLPEKLKDKLVIKVIETKTVDLINKSLELIAYEPQYRVPWIVFDRDQVKDFDEIIQSAKSRNIGVGWSNPCFEIWMYAYFGNMPAIHESWTCCSKFGDMYKKKTGQEYSKTDSQMYKRLITYGDEEKAFKIAESKKVQCKNAGYSLPSEMCPCTNVDELVSEIVRRKKLYET